MAFPFFVPLLGLSLLSASVLAQELPLPANAPAYMPYTWRSALGAPWPALTGQQLLSLLNGGIGPVIPLNELDPDGSGLLGSYNPGGLTSPSPTPTVGKMQNAFFHSFGTNGRTCGTCHQPASGMSVSADDIVARFIATAAQDPLFAPVDGANCPSSVPSGHTRPSYFGGRLGEGRDEMSAHSLLLNRGVFRIFLPLPKVIPPLPELLTFSGPPGAAPPTRTPDPRSGQPIEFSVKVVHDPNGCNTDPRYAFDSTDGTPILSNYRRPRISTNLNYVTNANVIPTGPGPSGNIMWDGREPTLNSQALDATLGHAQALPGATSPASVQQMVDFENFFFSAQAFDYRAGDLSKDGATGGPANIAAAALSPSFLTNLGSTTPGNPVFTVYPSTWPTASSDPMVAAQRASIVRGQTLFNTKQFTIQSVAGLSDLGFDFSGGAAPVNPPNPAGTCTTCHSQVNDGSDSVAGAQHNLGIAGDGVAFNGPPPAQDLPIFEVTCTSQPGGPNEFLGYAPDGTSRKIGSMFQVNDLGRGGITGLCQDVGKFTVSPLRALAGHPPYFHDGSAKSLLDVVNFYDKRFSIGFTAQEKTDLVNFLSAL